MKFDLTNRSDSPLVRHGFSFGGRETIRGVKLSLKQKQYFEQSSVIRLSEHTGDQETFREDLESVNGVGPVTAQEIMLGFPGRHEIEEALEDGTIDELGLRENVVNNLEKKFLSEGDVK